MYRRPWAICALIFLAGGCASNPCHERGWVGGTTKRVARADGFLVCGPRDGASRVIGMPRAVCADSALLVTRLPACSPAAAAGLEAGDLVLAVDGGRVEDPMALRRAVEARAPGSIVRFDVWRCGQRVCVPVVVGRETYTKHLSFGLGLPLRPVASLDLWPFDDGIDVLGLVQAKCVDSRYDLDSPERRYLRCAAPGASIPARRQETVHVGVLPLFVSTGVEVVRQEAAPRG